MTTSTVTIYPVDNGAMTLIKLNDNDETTILCDMYIRSEADDPDGEKYDVASHLRKQLKTDNEERPYIDVFLLSHNDDDHIKGLEEHFHLGPLDEYVFPEDEDELPPIIINEIWGSSRFWKRSSTSNKLCSDAKAFNKEMKRRIQLFKDEKSIQSEGDRALILGYIPEEKADGIEDIVQDVNSTFSYINSKDLSDKIGVLVLGPLPQQEEEEDDDFKEANRGSVIVKMSINEASIYDSYDHKLLLPGDADVFVWEQLWSMHKAGSDLNYDILLTPHHCSWRALSSDSESDCDDPKISDDAKSALSKTEDNAYAIATCKPIKNDDDTPPSYQAKKEYIDIVGSDNFICTAEHPEEDNISPIIFNLTAGGPQKQTPRTKPRTSKVATAAAGTALPHG